MWSEISKGIWARRAANALVCTLLTCLALAAQAAEPSHGDDAPTLADDASATALPDAASPSDLASAARAEDAAMDHGIVATHAETIGAGQIGIDSYEIFIASVTYGLTNDLQASVTLASTPTEGTPMLALLNGKLVVWRRSGTVLSVNAALGAAHSGAVAPSASVQGGPATTGLYLGGGIALDQYVHPAVALHGTIQLLANTNCCARWSPGLTFEAAAGVTVRANRFVKVLTELWLPVGVNSWSRGALDFMSVNYGVRFFFKRFAADLAFIRPVTSDVDPGFVLGIPFVHLTGRF